MTKELAPLLNINRPSSLGSGKELMEPPFPLRFRQPEIEILDQCCRDLAQLQIRDVAPWTDIVSQSKLKPPINARMIRRHHHAWNRKVGGLTYRDQEFLHLLREILIP